MTRKPRDMSGSAYCSECGARAVHERGPGTPLVIDHLAGCSEHPTNRPEPTDVDEEA